ncbi:hypothetical protein QEH68_18345 [Paenarthrobacter sp. OM7]|uniref:Uncharacterized protein n=1 Tax=Paenarthrobacter sp. AMU7 TaxID=3162492 RepID=A0AB39YNM8_9MICC|nr:hypothetical protein [Paenarthrobacter sp. OM7]WGM19961.1 hypothetical protein QEH68_18345 [Paenarthrobacter sp. OM7]
MSQNPSDADPRPVGRERNTGQKSAPLVHHNPVAQQMLIVGRRREDAEAKLAQLRRGRTET